MESITMNVQFATGSAMEAEVVKTDKSIEIHLAERVYMLRDAPSVVALLREKPASLLLVAIKMIKELPKKSQRGPAALCELSFKLESGEIHKGVFSRVSQAQFDARDTFRALNIPLPGSVLFLMAPQATKPKTPKQLAAAEARREKLRTQRAARDVVACLVAEKQEVAREAKASAKALARLEALYEAAKLRAARAKTAADALLARQ
jgi:hypothetical protein